MSKLIRTITRGLIIILLTIVSLGVQDANTEAVIAEAKASAVKLTEFTDHMYVGEVYNFRAKVLGTKEKVKWSISNKSVASITPDGRLTALEIGTVTVTARAGAAVKKQKVFIEKKELTAKELYKKCSTSTVEITAINAGSTYIGSGFFSAKNQVVTNYHVIAGANQITIKTQDEKEFVVSRILGCDANIDLAVLEVNAKDYEFLRLCSEDISVGEAVYALGSPLGLTGTMTDGMVSSASRIIGDVDYIQITAPISQGNSGGPLVNVYGEVVGVNTMYYENGQNLNFSINIRELAKIDMEYPLTVADYSDIYWKLFYTYDETNIINEDPALSQNPSTCQEIPSNRKVSGRIMVTEALKGDVYQFKIIEEGWFYGCILLSSKEDFKHTYFELYDSKLKKIAVSHRNEGRFMLYTVYYLSPGDYYVFACVPEDYSGTDIQYGMVLTYGQKQ